MVTYTLQLNTVVALLSASFVFCTHKSLGITIKLQNQTEQVFVNAVTSLSFGI